MFGYLYPVTLSVIIVSYNVKSLLEQCLRSVQAAINSLTAEVFIVDNASTDGSVEYLQPFYPQFHFISNASNLGFAKANNLALEKCSGKYVLFLNPDTIVPADCFTKCIRFLDQNLQAGALGVKMVDGNNLFLRESKRGIPTPSASFWKLTGMASLFPRSPIFSAYYAGHLTEDETHEVDVLSGAFMLVRKQVLDITGGFDERFFMYAEDIDLSYRILQTGHKNYYFAETVITHFKGSSTKKDIKYVKQFYRAMSQYVRKHYGNGPYALLLESGIYVRGGIAAVLQFFRGNKKAT